MLRIKCAGVALALLVGLLASERADAALVNYDIFLNATNGLSGSGTLTVDTAFIPNPNATLSPGAAVTELTIDIGTSHYDLTNTFLYVVFQLGNPHSIGSQTFVPAFLVTGGAGYTYQYSLGGEFGTGLITFAPAAVAAIPEPSTWTLVILGFAGIGFLAYRKARNRALGVAAA